MTIPTQLTIGTVTFQVVEVANLSVDGKPYLGLIEHGAGLIKLSSDQSEDSKLVTFWHEVVHGMLRQAGQKHSEGLTDALSHGLVALFQANGWTITEAQGGSHG